MLRLGIFAGCAAVLIVSTSPNLVLASDQSLTCDGWRSRWTREANKLDHSEAVEFASKIPMECPQLADEVNARIRALTPRPPPRARISVGVPAKLSVSATPTVPDWKRQPTQEEMEHFYPPEARAAGAPGSAIIECNVGTAGFLYKCGLVSESPAGMQFGEQALAMSRLFEFRPATSDGKAVDSGRVRIPIQFSVAPSPVPLAPTIPAKFRTRPSWLDVLRAYPELKQFEGKGALYLDCLLATNGTVYDCRAEGYGSDDPSLVQAALKMSRLFKLSPPLREGKPVPGARINIPILFGSASGQGRPSR